MIGPRPTREELDASSLRTVARHAIAPLERDLRRAEARLETVSTARLVAPTGQTRARTTTAIARHRSAAEQVARLRDALALAREIAAGLELKQAAS